MLSEGSRSGPLGSGGLHQEKEDRKSKVKSDFGRQKIVETGLVRNACSSVSLSASDGRVWIGSSVKSFSVAEDGVSVVAFERDSSLEGIWKSGFRGSELQSIVVPSSVVVLGKDSFYRCNRLELVIFESGSRLERIEESAFCRSGLKSIEIPSSVVILGKSSFYGCKSFESVRFESAARLERIEESAFFGSGMRSIEIPSSVIVLSKWSFYGCNSLESVRFECGSRLERIEGYTFSWSGLKSIEVPAAITFIDGSAFAGFRLSSVSISLSSDNRRFRIRECLLEDFDGSTIYRYFGSCCSIAIPCSVVVLDKWCFGGCNSLKAVRFERVSRLERIKEYAFQSSGLKSISIPSSVVFLGKWCFCGCRSLESVTFEDGSRLERIEDHAFRRCGLKSILIPSSVVVLGKGSFSDCKSLESVTFQSRSRLERIDRSVFEDSCVSFCSVLQEFTRNSQEQ
jgi:hypothetical protein